MNDIIEIRKLIDQLEDERVEIGNALWLLGGRVGESLSHCRELDGRSPESEYHRGYAEGAQGAIDLISAALAKLAGGVVDASGD